MFKALTSAEGIRLRSFRCAFTLAEVLITLGIIGIIAAITLPALTSKYQKMVLKNQFKKTYSVLSQALLKAKNDFGTEPMCFYKISGWVPHHCAEYNEQGECTRYVLDSDGVSPLPPNAGGYGSDCGELGRIFLSELKIVKSCQNKAYEKGCIAKYAGNDTMYKEKHDDVTDVDINKATTGVAGYRQKNLLNVNPAYVLSDGQILGAYGSVFNPMLFYVDVNGKKGPNKWGYDVFGFRLAGELGSAPSRIECSSGAGIEKGGYGCSEMMK